MSSAILAYGAMSPLGVGADAVHAGEPGAPAKVALTRDAELVAAGLARPYAARADVAVAEGEDRATAILGYAMRACAAELDRVDAGWRRLRVGLVLGTSSGGMRSAERLFGLLAEGRAPTADDAARAAYFGPLHDVLRAVDVGFTRVSLVLAACTSSTIALGLADRWLALGECDRVLAGGFDAVSVFVAAGFEVLQATSATLPPRPFRIGRDGMALGEGAAVIALARRADAPRARAFVAGFGASADAVHLTAPDRTGSGLARAARAALDDAGGPAIGLVSAHATATPFNDAAESRALAQVLGEEAGRVVVHPFKAQIGHTLGAAGALETLAAIDALERGVLPAAAGAGALDPDASVRLLDVAAKGMPSAALKLSSAFGGANAALVVSRAAPRSSPRAARSAFVTRAVHVTDVGPLGALAAAVGYPEERLARADAHVLLAIAALRNLQAALVNGGFGDAPLAGAGIVVGTALATLETNARFEARIRERGARFAEPRRFAYTSPNAVGGECGVVFRLTGPAFSVGAGPHAAIEALSAASTLVRAGDAERMVVVAVDEVGDVARACREANALPSVRQGAVALLVTAERRGAFAAVGPVHLPAPTEPTQPGASSRATSLGSAGSWGHAALLPLASSDGARPPLRLTSGVAEVLLEPFD